MRKGRRAGASREADASCSMTVRVGGEALVREQVPPGHDRDGVARLDEVFHDAIVYPSSKEMSVLSFEKFQNNDFEDVAYFEPYYLKDFMTTSKI